MERNEGEWAEIDGWRELVHSTLPESDVWSEEEELSPDARRWLQSALG